MTICAKCGERPASPWQAAHRSRWPRCSRCLNATDAGKRARRNYMRRGGNARRIWVGGVSYGYAKTAAEAQAIRAHGAALLTTFKERQRELES